MLQSLTNPFKQLPPLEASDRFLTEPPLLLTKYVNRRKCEIKGQERQKNFAELMFSRFNPDGRFLFVGSQHGSIYLYNTYDFSFHYQYYICNSGAREQQGLTDMRFYVDNSNLTYISTDKGNIIIIPNILHYDSQDKNVFQLQVFQKQRINQLKLAHNGEQMAACGENGKIALLSTKNRLKPSLEKSIELFQKSVNCCSYLSENSQILAAGGDNIKLIDTRANEVQQSIQYVQNSEESVNRLEFARNSLLIAAGTQGVRVFDIRNSVVPVFASKSRTEVTSLVLNPKHYQCFITGDVNGEIGFYDFDYTNQNFSFQACEQFSEYSQSFEGQTSQLYKIGNIVASHHTVQNIGVKIIDLDVHPLVNSLATSGADRDVRFWTYFGAGSFQYDKFHGGSVDPTKTDLQFNQSHRELLVQQNGDSEFFQSLKDIRSKETRAGEDIFSREEVQDEMRKYISTAEDRYREAEEIAGGFTRQ